MKRFYSIAVAGVMILGIPLGAYADDDDDDDRSRAGLVRLHAGVAGARAVGVFAACSQQVASEECAFTVESVRYAMAQSAKASTKFDAICIDIGFPAGGADNAWNCSPVTLEGLAVSVDAGAGGSVSANGGLGTGVASGVGSSGQVSLGLGVALPISSRLQVPMAQHASTDRPSVRLGGNILMESRIGSVPAGQTMVFGHTPFDGVVTFMVTRPASMTLTIGYVNGAGETKCNKSSGGVVACPAGLDRALRSACELSVGGACSSSAEDAPTTPTTAFGPAIDVSELRASLEKRQETISMVNGDLKEKLPDKITEVFELLENDEDEEGGNVAALPRLKIFAKVKAGFQKILAKVDEIKETVKEHVPCPF